jgi:hypothetical protein
MADHQHIHRRAQPQQQEAVFIMGAVRIVYQQRLAIIKNVCASMKETPCFF